MTDNTTESNPHGRHYVTEAADRAFIRAEQTETDSDSGSDSRLDSLRHVLDRTNRRLNLDHLHEKSRRLMKERRQR